MWPVTARLEYPPDESPRRRIALLRGRLNATIVARSEPVELVKDGAGLRCGKCKRVYPVKDDIPVMLLDEATIEP